MLLRSFLLLATSALAASTSFQAHYLGLNTTDQARVLALDSAGNSFVVSTVLQPSGLRQMRATKLDTTGNIIATLDFGTSTDQVPFAAATDSQGDLLVTGSSFVMKLDTNLTHVVASTSLNGTITAVAADSAGNVFVSGGTNATNFPVTAGAYQTRPPGGNSFGTAVYAFVEKLTPSLNQILYATYFGGDTAACSGGSMCIGVFGRTNVSAMTVDAAGEVIIAGFTSASDLPVTAGVYATQCSCSSTQSAGFLAKFSASGASLLWSTFLPPTGNSVPMVSLMIESMTLDASGNIVVSGSGPAPGVPTTTGVIQPVVAGAERASAAYGGFVAKFDSAAQHLLFGTYFGGGVSSVGFSAAVPSIAVDSSNTIWLTGTSIPADLPGASATGLGPNFVASLSPDGTTLGTLYTAPAGAAGQSIAVGPTGTVAVLGSLGSLLISSPGSQPTVLGVANVAGTNISGQIAPMEIVAIYGYNLGPATPLGAQVANGLVTTSLNGYQVTFNGIAAPLLYVGASQINAVVPVNVEGQSTVTMRIVTPQATTTGEALFVTSSQPAIVQDFTSGYASALNQDQTVNSAANPAAAGSVVTIWASGAGTFLQLVDGMVIQTGQNNPPMQPISVLLLQNVAGQQESTSLEVLYAGGAPGLVDGVLQVNFQLPAVFPQSTGSGLVYVALQAGSAIGTPVTIHVHP